MITNNFYHEIINNLDVGYAYHRIICNAQGVPVDYEFIEVNKAFEAATGLIAEEIIGKKRRPRFYPGLETLSLTG